MKPADVSSTLTSPSELSLPPPVSSDQTSSNSNGALSEVDVALMKLDEKLEAVAKVCLHMVPLLNVSSLNVSLA